MTKEFSPMTANSNETNPSELEGDSKHSEFSETKSEDSVETQAASNNVETSHSSLSEAPVDTTDKPSLTMSGVIPNPLLDFKDAGFSENLQNLLNSGTWRSPRPLDSMVLPHSLKGEDVVVQAESKTSSIIFLTLAHRLEGQVNEEISEEEPRALVIFSSEEAAQKSYKDFTRLFGSFGLSAKALKDPYEQDEPSIDTASESKFTHIIFASPVALSTAMKTGKLSLDKLQILVCRDFQGLSETSQMQDFDFVLSQSKDAQKIIFSKSFSESLSSYSAKYLKDANFLSLEREKATIASVTHLSYLCDSPSKFKILMGLLKEHDPKQCLIYTNNKMMAAWLYHKLLENSFSVEQLTSEQHNKENTENKTKIYVTTDIEGRYSHLSDITHVYNFDLPESGDLYLSRMGQVGKKNDGVVCSLVCDEYGQNYQAVQDLLGQKAPKPQWPNEEFLKIEDKSGNPFLEKDIGYVEKRRDFGDRPQRGGRDRGDSSSFHRKDRHERGERGERQARPSNREDRKERSEGIQARPRYEAKGEREETREFSNRSDRHERSDREPRPDRNERFGRFDRDNPRSGQQQANKIGPPQIKPRPRRAVHNPMQVKPFEQRAKVTPREQKKGLLARLFSLFSKKKS